MPLTPTLVKDYNTELLRFLGVAEGSEPEVYGDIYGVPTVGKGYTFIIRLANGSYQVRNNWHKHFDAVGIVHNTQDDQQLTTIANMLNNSANVNTINASINGMHFSFEPLNSTKSNKLAIEAIEDEFANETKRQLGTALYSYLEGSKELMALISMVYQGWGSAISSKAPGLIDALKNGNRAEAWYAIRYAANVNAGWKAERRIGESNQFSLFENSDFSVQAKDIIHMFTLHKPAINTLENTYSQYAGRNSIIKQISPARDYLIAQYGEGINIDGDVQVGKGLESYAYLENGNYNDTLKGTNKNDLIFGERGNDYIEAQDGDDVIYGGDGKDVLIGGKGLDKLYGGDNDDILLGSNGEDDVAQDILEGGSGFDSYVVNIGDIIKDDTNNKGRVIFENIDLTGTKTKVEGQSYYKDDHFYYEESGYVLYVRSKSSTSGLGLEIQNWNPTTKEALGIKLQDLTPPEFTIIGYTANENEGTVTGKVVLTQAYSEDIVVHLSTLDDSAHAGEDYVAKTRMPLTIKAGMTEKEFSVSLMDNEIAEGRESFFVQIDTVTDTSNDPISYTIKDITPLTIEDDDILNVSVYAPVVGESAGMATGAVTLSHAYDKDLTITLYTQDNTATSTGVEPDYRANNAINVKIAAGSTYGTFDVEIKNDETVEPTETFYALVESVTDSRDMANNKIQRKVA